MVSRLPKCCFDPTVNETNAAEGGAGAKRCKSARFGPGGAENGRFAMERTILMQFYVSALAGLLAIVFCADISPALAAGDAAAGKALAERSCASCHLVSPDQTTATTEAPPFQRSPSGHRKTSRNSRRFSPRRTPDAAGEPHAAGDQRHHRLYREPESSGQGHARGRASLIPQAAAPRRALRRGRDGSVRAGRRPSPRSVPARQGRARSRPREA